MGSILLDLMVIPSSFLPLVIAIIMHLNIALPKATIGRERTTIEKWFCTLGYMVVIFLITLIMGGLLVVLCVLYAIDKKNY